jgi:hypothetical protein
MTIKERLDTICKNSQITGSETKVTISKDDFLWLVYGVDEQTEKLNRCESLLSEAQDALDDVHCYETEIFQEITRYFKGD